MKPIFAAVTLSLMLMVWALPCVAVDRQFMAAQNASAAVLHGGSISGGKSTGDTLILVGPWGSAAAWNGQFENATGGPDWNGWTSRDLTQRRESFWSVDAADPGQPTELSAWCGDPDIPPCDPDDPAGGYGNNWHEVIEYRLVVDNPDSATAVQIQGDLWYSLEPGYDWLGLAVWRADQYVPTVIQTWDDTGSATADVTVTYLPGEYRNGNQIVLQFQVFTDEASSDEDCRFTTSGAARLDDLSITVTNAGQQTISATDFQDGTYGDWAVVPPVAVGDFAQLWQALHDQDPCRENSSSQLAFVDDGLVVPGTGGTDCQSFCYGPTGFAVNTRGGLLGPEADLDNAVFSPVLTWPAGAWDGCQIAFDWYLHELNAGLSGPIYAQWAVRSTASGLASDIESAAWIDRNWSYSGNGAYTRYVDDVSDLIVTNPRHVQLRLRVYEPVGWWFGEGNDSTPAPYFDNVRISAFRKQGPAMAARDVDLANDGFPASGGLDAVQPGANSVRFDMGVDISPDLHLRNDPGDSIVISLRTTRVGAGLSEAPALHYRLIPNPEFDQWRTAGLPNQGQVPTQTGHSPGLPFSGKLAFDLPDTGFLFPGDVLHYYIAASDEVDGIVAVSTLPADTTGFSSAPASGLLAYDPRFTMRALPSLSSDPAAPGAFVAPTMLIWNDDGSAEGWSRWSHSLEQLGLVPGTDYDIYTTRGAASGAGNGLGGRATALQVSPYDLLVYTSGTQNNFTLSDGDLFADASDDLGLLQNWLGLGGKNLFLSGDNLAADLSASGGASVEFMQEVMGVNLHSWFLAPMIGNQVAPEVAVLPGNIVFENSDSWLASGGCENLNRFDAITPAGATISLAEFTGAGGQRGLYDWSAGTLNLLPASTGRVVFLPYDLQFVGTIAKSDAPLTARTRLLARVIGFLGYEFEAGSVVSGVPGAGRFAVSNYPNPFNPRTAIHYEMPESGHLTLKVFDIRGHCVRTLIDGLTPAGAGQMAWHGRDDHGARVASGTYFYQAQFESQLQTGKMILLK